MTNFMNIPIGVLTDSYKATHFDIYPDSNKMVAYGEFRWPYDKGDDQRFVFYGIRYIVETYLNKKWTVEDVKRCEQFYSTHNAGFTPYPFPKDLFLKFIKENNGYFPIKVEALPEGTVAHNHVPVYQITAEKEYSRLCTFFETLLTQVWYPTTVATLSRKAKDEIEEAFKKSVDDETMFLLESRLHDFGFRGCTSVEQSVLGGCAHLLNFEGTDTMSAAYYAQFELNDGKPVGSSIPATEHSIMTAYRTEKEAIEKMMVLYGKGVFATVMDSYDYERALNVILPQVAEMHKANKGLWVLRPDSGDPVDVILKALEAGEKTFGSTPNKKGYKVLNGVGRSDLRF
jgi:nicotinic acid phosphoribosyltransferase